VWGSIGTNPRGRSEQEKNSCSCRELNPNRQHSIPPSPQSNLAWRRLNKVVRGQTGVLPAARQAGHPVTWLESSLTLACHLLGNRWSLGLTERQLPRLYLNHSGNCQHMYLFYMILTTSSINYCSGGTVLHNEPGGYLHFPRTHWTGGCVDPRTNLDAMEKRKIACPSWECPQPSHCNVYSHQMVEWLLFKGTIPAFGRKGSRKPWQNLVRRLLAMI
jgi:hypothetical protein